MIAAVTVALFAALSADSFEGLHGRASVGAALFPKYEGARETTPFPFVGGRLQLGKRYVQADGFTVRANVLGTDTLELGPVVNYNSKRDPDKGSQLAALGTVDSALELGAFIGAQYNAVGLDAGSLRLAVWAVQDVSGVHHGGQGFATAYYALRLGPRWNLGCEASVSAATQGYARTYFSVTEQGAAASGLPVYSAHAGLKDAGFVTNISFALTERWWLTAAVSNRFLVASIADSPIVRREGRGYQLAMLLAASYNF